MADETEEAAAATYTQELVKIDGKLDAILAAVTGHPAPNPPQPPQPPTPTPTPTPTPVPTPTPTPVPPAKIQAVYWVNQSGGDISDADCQHFVTAMNIQAGHLVELWPGLEPVAHVLWTGDVKAIPAAAWVMYFLRDADTAGALGYHDVDPNGRPYGRVFTRYKGKPWPALRPAADGISVSNIASHEGLELQLDPPCTLTATAPNGDVWALEDCDPVEAFSYDVTNPDGTIVSMSDGVGAAFFGQGTGKVDIMGKATPFTVAAGGYAIINGRQVFADEPSLRCLSQQGLPVSRTIRRLIGWHLPSDD